MLEQNEFKGLNLIGSLRENEADGDDVWKRNFAFLRCVLTIMEFNCYERFEYWKKNKIVVKRSLRPHNCKTGRFTHALLMTEHAANGLVEAPFSDLRFWRQREPAAINLTFSAPTWKPFAPILYIVTAKDLTQSTISMWCFRCSNRCSFLNSLISFLCITIWSTVENAPILNYQIKLDKWTFLNKGRKFTL